MKTATIFDIQRGSYVDGPGLRTTVFFKGCNLRCAWCHNPESQGAAPQLLIHKNRCTGCGKCREVCEKTSDKCDLCGMCVQRCPSKAREICGKEYTVDEVMAQIRKDKLFYETSGGGATFSGGECMLEIDFLFEILKRCREEGIHTAVDTAGHIPFEYFEKILSYTDLFLYDIKCFDTRLHQKHIGVGNELILNNLKRLLKAECRVFVRIPIIPTVNDTVEEMLSIRDFLDTCGAPEKIELLPYHAMGEHKYAQVGREACHFLIPDGEKMNTLKKVFD